MNNNVNEMDKRIQEGKLYVDKLVKEFKIQQAIRAVGICAITTVTVVAIIKITNKLDGSLKTEAE